MLQTRTRLAVVFAIVSTQLLVAQTPLKPTAPGTPGDPMWQGVLRLSDGRTFVTDGGLAIDAALAKPAKLPDRELATKVLESYLDAPHKDEYALNDLTAAASGKTYTTPSGVALNATYIDYLRRTLPRAAVRLGVTAPMQPVAIRISRKAVGVLMPVKQ